MWLAEAQREKPITTAEYGVPAGRQRHRLARIGKLWHFRLNGNPVVVPDCAGMTRIARLLKAPGQELQALDLVAGSSPPKTEGWRVANEDSAVKAGEVRPVTPPARARQSKSGTPTTESLNQLGKQPVDAQERDDRDAEATAWRHVEAAGDKLLAQDKATGGARLNNPHERARTTVRNSIVDALKLIQAESSELHDHLDESIVTGYSWCYDPKPREEWDVQLSASEGTCEISSHKCETPSHTCVPASHASVLEARDSTRPSRAGTSGETRKETERMTTVFADGRSRRRSAKASDALGAMWARTHMDGAA